MRRHQPLWHCVKESVAETRRGRWTKPQPQIITMKTNWNEIESRINFGEVSNKLAEFTISGAGRRKTVGDLLDKVKDALLKAHSEGSSYRALAAFLKSNGLPVSEPTLRKYLRSHGAGKPRKKVTVRPAAKTTPSKSTGKPVAPAKVVHSSPSEKEAGFSVHPVRIFSKADAPCLRPPSVQNEYRCYGSTPTHPHTFCSLPPTGSVCCQGDVSGTLGSIALAAEW